MTTDFALDLAPDGVRLLAQTDFGDDVLGAVALNEPAFRSRLAELRRTAGRDGALPVDLIIPAAQILYTRVEVGDGDPQTAIRTALNGATPYRVDELAWDARIEDGTARLAVVARETLAEAAEFARSHHFVPLDFLARPERDAFPGRPVFKAPALEPASPGAEPSPAVDPAPPSAGSGTEPREIATEPDPIRAAAEVQPRIHSSDRVSLSPVPEAEGIADGSDHQQRDSAGPPLVVHSRRSEPAETSLPDTAPDMAAPEGAAPPAPGAAEPHSAKLGSPERPRSEAEALTLFGARERSRLSRRQRGLPLAMAGLAAALAAAWFAFPGLQLPTQPRTAGLSLAAGDDVATAARGAAADPSAVALAAAADPAAPMPAAEPEVETASLTYDVPQAGAEAAEAETTAAPGHAMAETGTIWQAPPADDLGVVALPAVDGPPGSADTVALFAPLAETDAPPDPFPLPPPAGMTFDMDERGLVRPTAAGAVTPDGAVVFAGQPPVVPPERDDSTEAPAVAAANDADLEATDVASAPGIQAAETVQDGEEAELSGAEAPVETAEGDDATEVAEAPVPPPNRPRARPAIEAPVVVVLAPAEGQATPRPRPGQAVTSRASTGAPDFNDLARQARQQTAGAGAGLAAPDESPAPPPAPAERADDDVREIAVAPRIPTRASVARQATAENVIRLNRVNLIGVYGSPSNRRALVRLPTGRYVKVKVGDRVDGGKVSAIQGSRLDYVKDGRRITLQMPRT